MQKHKYKVISHYHGRKSKKPITQEDLMQLLEVSDEMVLDFTKSESMFHEENMKRLALLLDEITGQTLKQRWAH